MMINTKLLTLFILFFVAVSAVSAAGDFDVDYEPIINNIASNESAEFELKIKNNEEEDRFTFITKDTRWSLMSIPLTHFTSGMVVGNYSSATTHLLLKPVGMDVGSYEVGIDVVSKDSGETKSIYLPVIIGSYAAGKPVVLSSVDIIPSTAIPQSTISIKINLENQNNINFQNLDLTISSYLINEQTILNLGPFEKKTVEFTSFINETKPMVDTIRAVILDGEEAIANVTKTLTIVSHLPEFEQKVVTLKSFLKRVDEITITNKGNVVVNQTVKILSGLFGSTVPKARIIKEEGKKYFVWDLALNPGQSTTVKIVRDYRTISAIIILMIIGAVLYYILRPNVVIKKSAVKISKSEGGVKDLKVILKVKNRSNKTVSDVKIEDIIPKIADLIKEEYIGTLTPSNVFKHETKGTVIRWEIPALESSEERILRYTLKSRLSILGDFNLPKAKATHQENGKKKETNSNKVTITG